MNLVEMTNGLTKIIDLALFLFLNSHNTGKNIRQMMDYLDGKEEDKDDKKPLLFLKI